MGDRRDQAAPEGDGVSQPDCQAVLRLGFQECLLPSGREHSRAGFRV